MNPTLEYVGKWAGAFDACVIIPVCFIALGLAARRYIEAKYKLPYNHWALLVITASSAILAAHAVRWTVWWIWSLQIRKMCNKKRRAWQDCQARPTRG
jgi:hypothetical protein